MSAFIDRDDRDWPGIFARWKMCLVAVDNHKGIWRAWEKLPTRRKAMLLAKENGNVLKAFGKFKALCILREVETRDWHWMCTGETPEVVYEKPRMQLTEHEKFAVDCLSLNGFRIKTLKEDGKALANFDLIINSQFVEMKNVSNANSSVSNQMKRARIKWYKLGLDEPARIVFTMVGSSATIPEVMHGIRTRKHAGETILLITPNSMILRI